MIPAPAPQPIPGPRSPTELEQLEPLVLRRERVELYLTPGIYHLYAQLTDAVTGCVYATVSGPPERCHLGIDHRGVIDLVIGDDFTSFPVSCDEAEQIRSHFGRVVKGFRS